VLLSGEALGEVDERGHPVTDENFLLLMNAYHDQVPFQLPAVAFGRGWLALVDTSCQTANGAPTFYDGGTSYPLRARSLVLLQERQENQVRSKDRRHEA
jgi:glycogen operon protein